MSDWLAGEEGGSPFLLSAAILCLHARCTTPTFFSRCVLEVKIPHSIRPVPEAAYLKDDIDNVRVLFTGIRDKPHAVEEARRMVEYHQLAEERMKSFTSGNQADRGE